MEFNNFIFPAPSSSYSSESKRENLVYIPRAKIVDGVSRFDEPADFKKESKHIPCLYLHSDEPCSKVMIYMHGNAEDVGISEDFLECTRSNIDFHIIAVEYPGYGIYKGSPEATRIMQDAINVFDYIATQCQWGESNIILFGRSIGCGPALQLAAMRNPFALILISPYTSLKGIVRSHVGCLATVLLRERFQSIRLIKYVQCPLFILHGKKDMLIPYTHSLELRQNYRGKDCLLKLSEKMDHNEFHFLNDFIIPLKEFLCEHDIDIDPKGDAPGEIPFPEEVLRKPKDFQEQRELPLSMRIMRKIF
eukprot:TRINITY_DN15048_c0_g1_i1.p1 TRINITY_DN15048_c0_g1~~TRINITY_DN15048_c0_g1_i1.p1  ORF type:complete len:306 (+),score=85.10 TRINITY_DN15048_c0_g1_i1:168-1085(+)